MHDFFETTRQLPPLSAESMDAFSAVLKKMELPKGHLLLKENSVCNYVYYIEKGLTRTFYYKDAKDITDWISTKKTSQFQL